jgi:HD-like signal output (HDOD) protein
MNTALAPRSLTHAELESALAAVRIPAYPAVVAEVMREAQKDDPQVKVLSRIIASDVGMSAMAVKLANSPMLRQRQHRCKQRAAGSERGWASATS